MRQYRVSQHEREPAGEGVLPFGKLPPDLLARLLGQITSADRRVVVGAMPGVDAAVIDMESRYLVVAMDPVTLSEEPGRFAVQINANDIAVMGAEPRWLLASILLPAGSEATTAASIMEMVLQACASLGVTLVGGHTEVTPAVTRPVVAACMLGDVAPERVVTAAGAEPGDLLLLAGPIAVEGTAVLCRESGDILRERGVSEDVIQRGALLLDDPGISVVPAVRALRTVSLPSAMHDPTEGGIITAVREMAAASEVGVRVERSAIRVLDVCRTVCDALDLDPLGLLASGSLLVALEPIAVPRAQLALETKGIPSSVIGTVVPAEEGMTLVDDDEEAQLPAFERDELARHIETAG